MKQVTTIEVPVEPDTARALMDQHRLAAVGRLIDRIVRPPPGHDPLVALLEVTAHDAQAAGLNDEAIASELQAYNAERRDANFERMLAQ